MRGTNAVSVGQFSLFDNQGNYNLANVQPDTNTVLLLL